MGKKHVDQIPKENPGGAEAESTAEESGGQWIEGLVWRNMEKKGGDGCSWLRRKRAQTILAKRRKDNGTSACNGFEEEGVMIAAASEAIWDDKGACGRMYKVRCIGGTNQGVSNPCRGGGSVVVKIVDLCPAPGCRGTIDLSQEAFAMIADPNEGKINIKFTQ
ncbi:hypothetical protein G4B88_016309 [Cannabis sativa]|uniref:Expansin-like EG45 domain-containing protein n=1 Tax=Cannabis sativa TaxID=3483 RepID=A0A7J6GLS9_CANSA|nr:hypothetical protein G4B88_016309 [Cannabis sativa]